MITPRAFLLPYLTALIAAQAQPTPAGSQVAKLYDIGDLVATAEPDTSKPAMRTLVPEADTPATNLSPIARLLRAFVKPPLQGDEEISPVGRRWIVALARPEQHAWIDRFLQDARQKKASRPLTTLHCRVVSIPELIFLQRFRPSLIDPQAAADDTPHLTRILAPGEATTAFLDSLEQSEDVTTLNSPRLSMWPLTIGHVAMLSQTAYVRDFEFAVQANAIIADPIVDVIQDGIVLQASVAPLQNGLLGVSLDATVADLKRPIETHEIDAGVGKAMKIQLPHLRSTKVQTAVEMRPGNIVVLAPPPLAGKRLLFIVEVTTESVPTGNKPAGKRQY